MYYISIGRPQKSVLIDKAGNRTELWAFPGDWNRFLVTVEAGSRLHTFIVNTREEADKLAALLNTTMCYGMAEIYESASLKD